MSFFHQNLRQARTLGFIIGSMRITVAVQLLLYVLNYVTSAYR